MSIVEVHKKESIESFKQKLNGDLSIPSIIKYLEERSHIGHPGMFGTESRVNKEALRLASVYLQDYVDMLENNATRYMYTEDYGVSVENLVSEVKKLSPDDFKKLQESIYEAAGVPTDFLYKHEYEV